MNTYTKLKNGSWGVRTAGQARPGAVVTVTKKSGEARRETIERVLWTGKGRDGRTVSLCSIAPSAAPARARHNHRRTGCSCGSLEGFPRNSDCRQCQYDSQ